MNKLISTKISDCLDGLYVNDLTKEMDKHIVEAYRNLDFETYICKPYRKANTFIYLIRFPGATRGAIKTQDNKIVDIYLNEVAIYDNDKLGIYDSKVVEAVKKYIGYELVLEGAS
jgi:hypothetical protein